MAINFNGVNGCKPIYYNGIRLSEIKINNTSVYREVLNPATTTYNWTRWNAVSTPITSQQITGYREGYTTLPYSAIAINNPNAYCYWGGMTINTSTGYPEGQGEKSRIGDIVYGYDDPWYGYAYVSIQYNDLIGYVPIEFKEGSGSAKYVPMPGTIDGWNIPFTYADPIYSSVVTGYSYSKGSTNYGTASSASANAYPNDARHSDGYWYVSAGVTTNPAYYSYPLG